MKTNAKPFGATAVAIAVLLAGVAVTPRPLAADESRPVVRGEVQRVDVDNAMITIDHEPNDALDMPAMTMNYRVPDAAMLQGIAKGMSVQFQAIEDQGELVIRALMTTD